MSNIISRTSRGIHHSLYRLHHVRHSLTSTTTCYSSPPLAAQFFHGLPNVVQPRFNTTTFQSRQFQTVISPTLFIHTSQRHLSVATTVSKEPKPDEKKPVQVKSEEGENSEESSKQTGPNEGKAVRTPPVSWMRFFLLCLTGVGVILLFEKKKKEYLKALDENAKKNTVTVEPSVGKAAVGGPFNLVNHEGKTVTEQDFKGKWTLIYFGFTHCPDICPDELLKLAAAIDKIKEQGIEVVPLFISVDPERDTVEQIRDYVKEFHPDLIGLTGSVEDIKKVARAYRVYYMKMDEEDSDYLVDHSIVMYPGSPISVMTLCPTSIVA